jgi:hypothetical protein
MTDDREEITQRLRADLDAHLQRAFAGQHLVAPGGPRQPGTFTARDVQEEVDRWVRAGADGFPPGHVRTTYTAAQAREEGRAVPADVPDHAVLEFEGVRADIDPAGPRITLTPQEQRWVWIEAMPPGAA